MSTDKPEFFEIIDPTDKRRTCPKRVIIIVIVLIVILAILGLSIGLTKNSNVTQHSSILKSVKEDNRRIDCYPEASSPQEWVDKKRCEARGCIFSPSQTTPSAPACYWPPDGSNKGLKVLKQEDLQGGKRWTLQIKSGSLPFNSSITLLHFTIWELSNNLVQFTFDDATNPNRYKVPLELNRPEGTPDSAKYTYRIQNDPFTFQLLRKETNTIIWDTTAGGLIFTDQFLQITSMLPSQNVYGFGENGHSSYRHDMNFKTWPMFSRDQFPDANNKNFYGVHPFYECIEDDGKTHGVFLFNSNAMEYSFTPAPMLTYRTLGGILDFYVMLGPSPEQVVQQYTGLIGRPYMPPYWALGFQLCRYGYKNTSDITDAVERTRRNDIPLDVQYADIDYMDHGRDFTIDKTNFADLPQYFNEIQTRGIRTIIILDPCIEINDTYVPYMRGKERDIFIKWPNRTVMPVGDCDEYNNTDMMGYLWPDWKVVFPDFFDARAEAVWTELVVEFKKTLYFDGIWIDMNEPANFGTNEEKPWNWKHGPPYWALQCPVSTWDDPPYRPKAAYIHDTDEHKARLSDKTICMVGVQANGTLRHYDVHNLYGHVQSLVTLRSMRAALKTRRGQLITRSTYPGSGAVAGHWLGDNLSTWSHLKLSIIGLLEFNLFGIPYIGADICGFFGTASPELCKRWMQLGAFYTFSRNHNHIDSEHQDPGFYGEEVAAASREALQTRYRLLPYLYTLFHKAHVYGNTVIRPLAHEYPTDHEVLGLDEQFLWGSGLLISPILEQNQTQITIYFPSGRWYNYYDGALVSEDAGYQDFPVAANSPIPLHLREGHIIPVQKPANNTFYSRQNDFGLLVVLDENGSAGGDLFWDDGESIDTYETGNYYFAAFVCNNDMLTMNINHNELSVNTIQNTLSNITVMGVSNVNEVRVNGTLHASFKFDDFKQTLEITNLDLLMTVPFTIRWIES